MAMLLAPLCGAFNLSNTLGDGMVLQRTQAATVWGFGDPGVTVTTTFLGATLQTTVGGDGVWRQALPPQKATATPTTLSFAGSDGGTAELRDVLFGDVYLCGGQSNMQYTPRSMDGMNNMSAEIAAADNYPNIRFFTVGMQTKCGGSGASNCTLPFRELNTFAPTPTCKTGGSCRHGWGRANASSLGATPPVGPAGGSAWDTFSAVCWLHGREVHDALGGSVPIGLISSNWGGTSVQHWQPLASMRDCTPGATAGGDLYNSMIAPFTVGPMAMTGAIWYQGEANVGGAAYYSCGFPSMISRWREAFKNSALWFGFVQIAGYRYSTPYGPNGTLPEVDHSHHAGDLRQSQLAALALPLVGLSTAVDTGDWVNIHPPDKQNPARRLAKQALRQVYGLPVDGAEFPMYAGSSAVHRNGDVTVTVAIRAGGKPVKLTTDAPASATQSTTLGKGPEVKRNECVTAQPALGRAFAEDCGYPAILGVNATTGAALSLNATATIGADGSSIVLSATAPPDFTPTSSSYGRASWPRVVFFADELPVIPWYANFSTTNPWTPPTWLADETARVQAAMVEA